jgi:pyruvate/2-oxoglutarate dehydrogenase complex dihydrolipoamide acyltransferase (E2) component
MKFHEARRKAASNPENKMLPGSRPGQKAGQSNPELLRGSRTTSDPRTLKEAKANPLPPAEITEVARRMGVDLASIKGTGKDGAITMRDVRKAAGAAKDEKENDKSTLTP